MVVLLAGVTMVIGAGCGGGRERSPSPIGTEQTRPPSDLTTAADWPTASADVRHSSATVTVGPASGSLAWTRPLEGPVTPGPVVGVDGSVLAASNAGVLHALDPTTGVDRWTFAGGDSYGDDLSTSATVLGDGTILWPGPNHTLFGLGPDGTERWRQPFTGLVLTPAVAGHRVYVASRDGRLSALDVTTGTPVLAWSLPLGGADDASPAIGRDGTIYTAAGPELVAVRDDGDLGQ